MSTVRYEDRLEEFKKTTSRLPHGAVLTAPGVRLLDLISSVEILDPRTDGDFAYESIRSFKELQRSGEILTETELQYLNFKDYQGFMQRLLNLEVQWLEGRPLPQTIFTCPFAHKLLERTGSDLLLYIYLRGVLKFLDLTHRIILKGEVREEDEFPLYTFGLQLPEDIPVGDILPSLLKSKVSVSGDLIVQAYLGLHISLIHVLHELQNYKKNETLYQVLTYLDQAQQFLEYILAQPPVEITPRCDKLFHIMTLRWVPTLTPLHPLPTLGSHEGLEYFVKLVNDLQFLCIHLSRLGNLSELLALVLSLSDRHPSLLVRSQSILLIYQHDSETMLHHGSVPSHVLRLLEDVYGHTLVRQIYDGNKNALRRVCEYRTSRFLALKKLKIMEKTPFDFSNPRQAMELVPSQVAEIVENVGKALLHVIYAALHNRAKYRRRLANLLQEFISIQHHAWDLDVIIFGGGALCVEHTRTTKHEKRSVENCDLCRATRKAAVFTPLILDLATRGMAEYLKLGFELQLYSQDELKAVYAYLEYLLAHMSENCEALYNIRCFTPRSEKSFRLLPPIVTTRKVRLPPASVVLHINVQSFLLGGLLNLQVYLERCGLLSPAARYSLTDFRIHYTARF